MKGLAWRALSTTVNVTVVYFFTGGEIDTALQIGAADFVLKYLLYVGHERLWALVPDTPALARGDSDASR